MAGTDTYYSIPDKPVYNNKVRELQNDDPSNAETTFNPLVMRILENIAAVKELADSALKLSEPRKIGNASFDGTADITLEQMGAATSGHTHPAQTDITGNAGTANKLKTARKIGNASFDGSANITLEQIGASSSGHTHSNMKAATASAAGAAGLVPAPAAGAQGKYLRGDGTWQTPPDTNTVYTHPTTAGNKHIPAGGSSGQILRWSSDGTAAWGADNNTTYGTGTASTSGLTKLYTGTGSATDGTMTQKVQTEKLNAKQNIKRGAVGQNGSTTTNPWYKFASCTVTGAHEDRWITFAVTTGYGDASNTIGILTAHFRTNSTKVWESGELKWQVAGSGIDPTKFVIAYKNTANTSCAVELWVKIDSGYRYYHFDAISEGNRSAFGDYWTLHSLSAAGSASAPSTGFTQIASTVLTLKNTAAYTHPTTAGNKHIPAGGSAGQILKWSAAGTAVWGDEGVYRSIIGIPKKSAWTYSSTYKIYRYQYNLTGNWLNRAVIPYGSNYDSLSAPIKFYGNIDAIDMETTEPPDSANSIFIIIL